MSADLPAMPDTVMVKGCCGLMLNEPCECGGPAALFVVEVNEGIVDITRQGAEWWNLYRLRFRGTNRIRDTKAGAIVGGLAEVACASREDADSLAAHMVEHGGLPKSAVKVRAVR